MQVLKLQIKQGFLDKQAVVDAVWVFGIRPQAALLLQLLPKDALFVLTSFVIAYPFAHDAAKLNKIPMAGLFFLLLHPNNH